MGTGIPLAREPETLTPVTGPERRYVILDETFKYQLELEQVDNTRDVDKPVSIATQIALDAIVLAGAPTPVQFTRASPATIWNLPHNLGHRPLINIFTTGWVELVAQIVHIDNNNTQVLFDTPQAGYAVLI